MEKSTLVPQVKKKNTTRKILNSNPIISVITLNKNELNSLIVKDETRFFFQNQLYTACNSYSSRVRTTNTLKIYNVRNDIPTDIIILIPNKMDIQRKRSEQNEKETIHSPGMRY